MNRTERAQIVFDNEKQNAINVLRNAAKVLESARIELQRSIDGIENKPEPNFYTLEQNLSGIVNHLASNVISNCRLDLMVSAAAKVATARAELNAAKGE